MVGGRAGQLQQVSILEKEIEMRFALVAAAVVATSLGAALVFAQGGDKAAERLVFKNHGFAIAPLDEPGKGTVLMMFMPPMDGFAANVNVQAQEYAGTMADYAALSRKQFEDARLKVLSEKMDQGVLTLEYAGELQGKSLHWYARAAQKGGTVYLVTGTASEGQWKTHSGKLKACVNSFELLSAKPTLSPARPQ